MPYTYRWTKMINVTARVVISSQFSFFYIKMKELSKVLILMLLISFQRLMFISRHLVIHYRKQFTISLLAYYYAELFGHKITRSRHYSLTLLVSNRSYIFVLILTLLIASL